MGYSIEIVVNPCVCPSVRHVFVQGINWFLVVMAGWERGRAVVEGLGGGGL